MLSGCVLNIDFKHRQRQSLVYLFVSHGVGQRRVGEVGDRAGAKHNSNFPLPAPSFRFLLWSKIQDFLRLLHLSTSTCPATLWRSNFNFQCLPHYMWNFMLLLEVQERYLSAARSNFLVPAGSRLKAQGSRLQTQGFFNSRFPSLALYQCTVQCCSAIINTKWSTCEQSRNI